MVRPTLRLVIGGFVATIVLVVAVTTLAITHNVSLATVRDIGKKHALALAATARVQNEEFFIKPVNDLRAMAAIFKHEGNDLPTSLPDQTAMAPKERLMAAMYTVARINGYTVSFVFEDGSAAAGIPADNGETFEMNVRFSHEVNSGGNMSYIFRKYNVTSSRELIPPGPPVFDYLNSDGRFPAYYSAAQIMRVSTNGAWYPVQVSSYDPLIFFVYPAVMPLYNRTGGFIGLVTATPTLTVISDFLHGVKGTLNTEVFAVQASGYLIGSTHATPFERTFEVADRSAVVGPGCSSTADTQYEFYVGPIYHACRANARDFPYAPLQKAAEDRGFITTATTELRVLDVGGEAFYLVSTPVANPFRFWGLNIVLCMPEADILGDIVAGRNLAIGVTAAVFVAAALLSFGLVYALLQPLSTVSRQMLDTANLRERASVDAEGFSSLAEIQDLQRAYSNMNTAIKSFTRYVPRAVVKDLMKSGQLCEIRMVPQVCTMLFVDIAGFTTVCERVPPAALSALVSQYFDCASRIVMSHDGLIDKFIGDCIMAVWGAPVPVASQEVKATLTAKLLDRATMVDPLSTAWDQEGEQLRVRVGVSTGEVLAGNMGSADRMNYTVIGDPVNLAARLESLNKQFGTRVMVSEMTAARLTDVFVLRLLMPIAVVGKEQPVKVFEVLGLEEDAPTAACVDAGVELATAANAGDGQRSDVGSEYSTATANGGGAVGEAGAGRCKRRTTSQMLTDAIVSTATALPVVCTAEEAAFAGEYSRVVGLYMAVDFAGALAGLEGLARRHPSLVSGKGEKSAALLQQLCEVYVREGAPQGFDGVYRALEK